LWLIGTYEVFLDVSLFVSLLNELGKHGVDYQSASFCCLLGEALDDLGVTLLQKLVINGHQTDWLSPTLNQVFNGLGQCYGLFEEWLFTKRLEIDGIVLKEVGMLFNHIIYEAGLVVGGIFKGHNLKFDLRRFGVDLDGGLLS
jgi:hypothetical protein